MIHKTMYTFDEHEYDLTTTVQNVDNCKDVILTLRIYYTQVRKTKGDD